MKSSRLDPRKSSENSFALQNSVVTEAAPTRSLAGSSIPTLPRTKTRNDAALRHGPLREARNLVNCHVAVLSTVGENLKRSKDIQYSSDVHCFDILGYGAVLVKEILLGGDNFCGYKLLNSGINFGKPSFVKLNSAHVVLIVLPFKRRDVRNESDATAGETVGKGGEFVLVDLHCFKTLYCFCVFVKDFFSS
jgi:hypothetical protein